jgi:hypothetical protein
MAMSQETKARFGTIPQWATSIFVAVAGYFAIHVHRGIESRVFLVETRTLANGEALLNSFKRIELLEQRYQLTDEERRRAIEQLKSAHDAMVLELKAMNANLARVLVEMELKK